MTRKQAIERLKKTRKLDTRMLDPLGISFESFLRFSQLPAEKCKKLVENLIAHYDR